MNPLRLPEWLPPDRLMGDYGWESSRFKPCPQTPLPAAAVSSNYNWEWQIWRVTNGDDDARGWNLLCNVLLPYCFGANAAVTSTPTLPCGEWVRRINNAMVEKGWVEESVLRERQEEWREEEF